MNLSITGFSLHLEKGTRLRKSLKTQVLLPNKECIHYVRMALTHTKGIVLNSDISSVSIKEVASSLREYSTFCEELSLEHSDRFCTTVVDLRTRASICKSIAESLEKKLCK